MTEALNDCQIRLDFMAFEFDSATKISNPVERMIAKPIDNDTGSGEKDQERIQECTLHSHCFSGQIFSSEREITAYFMASYQGSVLSPITQYILFTLNLLILMGVYKEFHDKVSFLTFVTFIIEHVFF